jgi:hypothetical protein
VVSKRIQLACVWSAPVFIVLYAIAFIGISRFLPPPSPQWSAQQVADLFEQHRMGIRIGQVLSLIFSTLLFPFFAVISVQIARMAELWHLGAAVNSRGSSILMTQAVVARSCCNTFDSSQPCGAYVAV